jgi:hypothetical protein
MYQMAESLGQSADMDRPGAEEFQRMWSGTWFAAVPCAWNSSTLHHMISAEPALSCATQTVENLSRSSSSWGTPPF